MDVRLLRGPGGGLSAGVPAVASATAVTVAAGPDAAVASRYGRAVRRREPAGGAAPRSDPAAGAGVGSAGAPGRPGQVCAPRRRGVHGALPGVRSGLRVERAAGGHPAAHGRQLSLQLTDAVPLRVEPSADGAAE